MGVEIGIIAKVFNPIAAIIGRCAGWVKSGVHTGQEPLKADMAKIDGNLTRPRGLRTIWSPRTDVASTLAIAARLVTKAAFKRSGQRSGR